MREFGRQPHKRARALRIVTRLACAWAAITLSAVAAATPALAAHEGFSRWCQEGLPGKFCPIWPGINNNGNNYARPYYYLAGSDNKGQTLICEVRQSWNAYWEWVSYGGGGHCSVGASNAQANYARVRFYSAVPSGGDGLGGLVYW
jgi:hypothetical protein